MAGSLFRLTSLICVIAAVLVNLSANAFQLPSNVNEWLSASSWVFCSFAFVVVTYWGFSHVEDSRWLWLLAPAMLACSATLSLNAGDRISSAYQASADRRASLIDDIKRAKTELDNGCINKPAFECVSSEQKQIIKDANAELRTLPLVSKVSSSNAALPFVLGLGPDLANAMMAIVAGIRRRKPEIVKREKEQSQERKQQRSNNVHEFKKKLRAKTATMGKKTRSGMKKTATFLGKFKPRFPTMGKVRPKGGKLPKKSVNNSGNQRKQRVCTDDEMEILWNICNENNFHPLDKGASGKLKKLSGMHGGKISSFRKRVKEGFNREARA